MINTLISRRTNEWFARPDCTARAIVEYIQQRGQLRDAQIEAIKTYLFLKIEGRNRPLHELFGDGFFTRGEDLSKLHISEEARRIFSENSAARALFEYSRTPTNVAGKTYLPELETYLRDNAASLDYTKLIKQIFYGVEYSDYLFSLPMGAGKTFLMAAFILLDLYFAQNEPENPLFAHNFLVLAPSGLKTSIVPSLKSIAAFDPTWVLPEPAATQTRNLIKFEILDQAKSGKKSNKARNPNAQKINAHQPFEDCIGLVIVTNAEKVILDRATLNDQLQLIEESDDERDKTANELRNIIGKIPHLQIHIDEVQRAATDDIKLRQVVNKWNTAGNINSVLGFSGTPYHASPEKIAVDANLKIAFTQITNTVFYYPLTRAIQTFLKKPTVKALSGLSSEQIVRRGVREWLDRYEHLIYPDGTIAKLAIYCGTIERLESEIAPMLNAEMGIEAEAILKFHKGNAHYKTSREQETEFASLDSPLSKKRIVLLVQIGKEGWDCRSLSGVILSQKGDCPTNMVLQTSCRCLRQVRGGTDETANIWLNAENEKQLDKQLKEEQHTSIAALNNLQKESAALIERTSRLEHLKLPPLDFHQLHIEYSTLHEADESAPRDKIAAVNAQNSARNANIATRELSSDTTKNRQFLKTERGEIAHFARWLSEISKASCGTLSSRELRSCADTLRPIFAQITFEENGARYFNDLFDRDEIASQIRLAWHRARRLQTREEIVPRSAKLLHIEKLAPLATFKNLYPNESDAQKIRELDASGEDISGELKKRDDAQRQIRELIAAQGRADLLELISIETPDIEYSNAVRFKDKTLHFLPYNFDSKLELEFLKAALEDDALQQRNLEIYFNGEKEITDFRIVCHTKNARGSWRKIGVYTPDFLVIERRNDAIYRALIVETKGKGFASQNEFVQRREFVEQKFVPMNNEEFGYNRFQYLYLSDENDMTTIRAQFHDAIVTFFDNNEPRA